MENTTLQIPARDEVREELKWRLEDIYVSDELCENDMAAVRKSLPELAAYAGKLGTSADTLLSCLRLRDRVEELTTRAYVYTHMRKDEDNTKPKYQAMHDRAASLAVEAASRTSFIGPEILTIPQSTLDRFMEDEPDLALYRHYIDNIVRKKVHTLSAPEERIVALAGEMAQGATNIFTMLNNADIKFPTIRDEAGQEVEVTKGRYVKFLESRDRRVRREAFEALYSSYRALLNTLSSTLGAAVKADVFFSRVRNYPSALAAALDRDNIPVDVYTNLIATIRSRLHLMHRYVRLRKRALGLDELHMYDMYTPIVPNVEYSITYEDARETVLQALAPLGRDYLDTLESGFSSGWVDVVENRGKTSGAYSWGSYGSHPFVLLNWQDTLDNMFTLAHEMGHAMHFHYSWATQPYVYSDYAIFVAEVASTVNEILLIEHLLAITKDQAMRMYLLNHYLESFRGTVFRQTMFAEFEKMTHEAFEAGEALTPEFLCDRYRQLNSDYYGADVVSDDDISLEWARIPHFYTAFYVYQYATGFSAAVALARRILEEGEPAVRRYVRFLSGGGSTYPIELLRGAGVDMTSAEPVNRALDAFEKALQEMESFFAS
ncbi:MAG: oligoendopeptidase F [Firmicutes bacterium]|nr:oligoendopeptidase F [Bacillota bacterium]